MKRTGLIVLGIMLAAANISGCASVAKEVVKQVLQDQEGEDEAKEEDKKSREDSEKEEKDVKLPAQDSDKSGADGALGSEGSKPESQAHPGRGEPLHPGLARTRPAGRQCFRNTGVVAARHRVLRSCESRGFPFGKCRRSD